MSVSRPCAYASAAALAVGGYVHFDLYRHAYQSIPRVGLMFAANVVISAGVAVALIVRRDLISASAALLLAVATLGSFAVSRTVGLLGFTETGLRPSPQATITIVAEAAATAALTWGIRHARRPSLERPPGSAPST